MRHRLATEADQLQHLPAVGRQPVETGPEQLQQVGRRVGVGLSAGPPTRFGAQGVAGTQVVHERLDHQRGTRRAPRQQPDQRRVRRAAEQVADEGRDARTVETAQRDGLVGGHPGQRGDTRTSVRVAPVRSATSSTTPSASRSALR